MTEGSDRFTLRFWGVRGSLPVPGPHTLRYGGNTACIEIRAGEQTLIIDGGSGAYALGKRLLEENRLSAHMLFTHTHLDHVCGLPFFKPAYRSDGDYPCWAGHLRADETLHDVLSRLMDPALFPVPISSLKGSRLNMFEPGETLEFGQGLSVRTILLNHPGGCCGFRVEWQGRSVAIITDHEHGNADIDAAITTFVGGTEAMIYDANYTEAEYENFVGWGHSTWQKGLEIGEVADVKKVYMFHHAPHRSDDQLDQIGKDMKAVSQRGAIATEGVTIDVTRL